MDTFRCVGFSGQWSIHATSAFTVNLRRAKGFKHGDVIVCATTACLHARLRTAPIRSRERQRADAQLLMTFCLKPRGALPAGWPARAGCSINRSSASRFRSTSTSMASFRSKVTIGILSSTLSTFSWALDKKQILTQYGHDATMLLGEETLATTTRPAFDFRSARCSFRCECWCHRL